MTDEKSQVNNTATTNIGAICHYAYTTITNVNVFPRLMMIADNIIFLKSLFGRYSDTIHSIFRSFKQTRFYIRFVFGIVIGLYTHKIIIITLRNVHYIRSSKYIIMPIYIRYISCRKALTDNFQTSLQS